MDDQSKTAADLWKGATIVNVESPDSVDDEFIAMDERFTGYNTSNSGVDDPNVEVNSTPFAITINGLEPGTDGDGLPIPASSFTIDCIGGDAEYPTATATLPSPTGVSADFAVGSGKKFWRVYGEVAFQRSASNKPLDTIIPSSSGIRIEESDTAAFGVNSAWRKKSDGYFYHYFPIGVIASVKEGNQRSAFVDQVQIGDYIYSDGSDGTSSSDTNGIDTRDGLREVTIAINGIAYTAEIEMANISAV